MAHRTLACALVVAIFGIGGVAALAPAAHAVGGTTITVTTTADDTAVDGNCSLREALQAANTDHTVDACPAGNGADTIVVAAQTYVLAHGPLEVQSDVTITGTTLRSLIDDNAHCCGLDRAVHVNTGADLTLNDMSIQNAAPAIRNDGTLDMETTNLDTNLASWHNDDGSDGLANYGTAILNRVPIRFTNNAIYNAPGAHLTAALMVFDHDAVTAPNFATVDNLGTMTIIHSVFQRDITCLCSSRVIENYQGQLAVTSTLFTDNSGIDVIVNTGDATISNSAFDKNAGLPIKNQEVMTITGTRISSNHAAHANPGAIANDNTLVVSDSTIDHNVGDIGGAITDFGRLTLTNDTIANNEGRFDSASGAIRTLPSGALTSYFGASMIRDTTIIDNTITGFHDWRGHAGGIVNMPFAYTALVNSIVSDNTAPAPVQAQDCFGPIHSLGYSLVENPTDCFVGGTTTGDVIGVSAHLRALAPNDGSTMTAFPPWDSPAVDAGSPVAPNDMDATTCTQLDQRGVARPRDGNADGISRCDMGAVER
jgi:CSLREA domain-containing protein